MTKLKTIDPVLNNVVVEVSGGYGAGSTSIALKTGEGASLPAPATVGEYPLLWWDGTLYPNASDDPNLEWVLVTARSGDTLTVTRAQQSTSASAKNTAGSTYYMSLAFSKRHLDDLTAAVRFTPQRFGAVADGTTDDATAIQAAIDAASTAGGGSVYCGPGTYLIGTKLTLPSNCGLIGAGRQATVIKGDDLTTALISSPNTANRYYNWLLRDIGFDNNGKATAGGIGIDLTNITEGVLVNVTVTNVELGLKLAGAGATPACFYNEFLSVTVSTVVNGIDILADANENHFWGGRVNDSTRAVEIDDNSGNSLNGTAIEVFTTGVRVGNSAATQFTRMADLRLENTPTSGTGIDLKAGSSATSIRAPQMTGLSTDISDAGSDTQILSDVICQIGGGSSIRIIDTYSGTIDFPSIAAGATSDQLITASGAAATDQWFLTVDASLPANLLATVIPSSGGVYVRLGNISGSAIDPASLTYRATRVRYN